MKSLIEYFIKKSLLVNLVTVMIIVVGLVTVYQLKKEMFPKVEFDVILVTTQYPGTTAEDVEKLVTIGIERELKSVDGIKKMNAMSAEGMSIIYLTLEAGENLQEVLDDVKNAVSSVSDLPEEATVPKVKSLRNRSQSIMKVSLFGVDYNQLRVYSKELRDRLEESTSIAKAKLEGYQKDEIKISVDPVKLKKYDMTLSEVTNSVKQRSINLSAGKIETTSGDILIRTESELETINDINNLIVRSNYSGFNVRIGDIAKVVRTYPRNIQLQRSNGQRAIFLQVTSKENSDIIKTTKLVKNITEDFVEKTNNSKLQFRYTDELAFYVKRRLNILKRNGLLGIVLVFACLLLFLNKSTSFVTSMGAPIAFMASFIIMDAFGLTINLISMFALILVLGMLVDDSIIVSEHFYQKLEKGMKPFDAARLAAIETIKPVTATILTTIVAFGSLFFMGGIMGKFLWQVPAVVLICLIVSWIECFFILPSHLSDFCRLPKRKNDRKWFKAIKKIYSATLTKVINHYILFLVSFFVLFLGTTWVAKNMRFELFPGDDVRIVFMQIKGKVGVPFSKTDAATKKIENLAMKLDKTELVQLKANVGTMIGQHSTKRGSHYSSVVLYLTPPNERERTTDEIIASLLKKSEALVPDYKVIIKKVQGGPPKGKAVEIELTSTSMEQLKQASFKTEEMLKAVDGVTSTEIDFEEGKPQIIVSVDNKIAKKLGVTTQSIAFSLRQAFANDPATKLRESDEDIDIIVQLDKEIVKTQKYLESLSVLNNKGQKILVGQVASFKTVPGAFVIRRLNTKRIFSITASIDKAKQTPKAVVELITPKVNQLLLKFPKVNVSFGGENEDTNESIMRLAKSGLISMFCIFLILVAMFGSLGQPIVIMLAIPLGLTGVVFSFKAFGLALGFMALMGVVGLIGVVVNDSIVLVNFINIEREKNDNLLEAIKNACISRLRPVLLTTFTTVAGLLPVAHAPGGDPFLRPMALSFAYGLLFATFITLFFIPSAYLFYDNTISWFQGLGKDKSIEGAKLSIAD
ncbi:MAG: efflux RND transporter permease subunit [Bdellovibrionales bacterium]|nr:efflux RND transporter permease subunit [Bdellovibrionales bacterium]